MGFRRLHQPDGGPRAGAVLDQAFNPFRLASSTGAGSPNHIDDVIPHFVVGENVINGIPGAGNIIRRSDPAHPRRRLTANHTVQDPPLFVSGRIIDANLHHEAVDLSFRQRIGTLLLNRILGGQHQKGRLQWKGSALDGHLLLLHCLQQG